MRYGLTTLKDKGKIEPNRKSPGLEMLLKVSGLDQNKQLTAEDNRVLDRSPNQRSWTLGQARLAVELLTTTNRQRAAQLPTI